MIDVVKFDCGAEVVVYDRLGVWAAPFRPGDHITLSRTKVELPGPITFVLELRAEWSPASPLD